MRDKENNETFSRAANYTNDTQSKVKSDGVGFSVTAAMHKASERNCNKSYLNDDDNDDNDDDNVYLCFFSIYMLIITIF